MPPVRSAAAGGSASVRALSLPEAVMLSAARLGPTHGPDWCVVPHRWLTSLHL